MLQAACKAARGVAAGAIASGLNDPGRIREQVDAARLDAVRNALTRLKTNT
jgi:hypothetical protein